MSKPIDSWKSNFGTMHLADSVYFAQIRQVPAVMNNMVKRCVKAILAQRNAAARDGEVMASLKRKDHVRPRVYAVGTQDCLYRKGGSRCFRVTLLPSGNVTVTNGSDYATWNAAKDTWSVKLKDAKKPAAKKTKTPLSAEELHRIRSEASKKAAATRAAMKAAAAQSQQA